MTEPYDPAPALSTAAGVLSRERHGCKNTRGAQDG